MSEEARLYRVTHDAASLGARLGNWATLLERGGEQVNREELVRVLRVARCDALMLSHLARDTMPAYEQVRAERQRLHDLWVTRGKPSLTS